MQNSAGSHLWERIGGPTSASIRITCFPINANSIDTLVSIQIQKRSSIRCALAIISRSFFPEWIRWTVTDVWKFTRSERLVERARFLASIIPKTASQKLNSQVIKQYKCKYQLERPRYHRFEIFRINKQSTATSYIHLQYRSANVLPLNRASLINQRSWRTFDRRTISSGVFSLIFRMPGSDVSRDLSLISRRHQLFVASSTSNRTRTRFSGQNHASRGPIRHCSRRRVSGLIGVERSLDDSCDS